MELGAYKLWGALAILCFMSGGLDTGPRISAWKGRNIAEISTATGQRSIRRGVGFHCAISRPVRAATRLMCPQHAFTRPRRLLIAMFLCKSLLLKLDPISYCSFYTIRLQIFTALISRSLNICSNNTLTAHHKTERFHFRTGIKLASSSFL